MAIITISRQFASLGDEISKLLAEKLGYKFIGKAELEQKIVKLGFPENKLHKFDEKKLGFFASLTRGRDEYLNYLQTAILESVAEDNCVVVGRGSFIILKDLASHISCRFIADNDVRVKRIMEDSNCDKKTAVKIMNDNDNHLKGFHKNFFNFDINDPAMFHLLLNTSLLDVDSIAESIAYLTKKSITAEKEEEGKKYVNELLIGQRIVNMLVFDYGLNINFLRAEMEENKIILHGVSESSSIVDRALTIVSCELPDYKIESKISVVQDFKAYGQ